MEPPRSWRELAALVAEEEDPQKILLLAQEMLRALDAESNKHMENISAAEKARGKKPPDVNPEPCILGVTASRPSYVHGCS